MELQIVERNNTLLGNVLTQLTILQSEMSALKNFIEEKDRLPTKTFIDDDELEKLFSITRSVRYKLIKEGSLIPYKINGKLSKSLYKYSEVVAAIESNVQFKKQ